MAPLREWDSNPPLKLPRSTVLPDKLPLIADTENRTLKGLPLQDSADASLPISTLNRERVELSAEYQTMLQMAL